MTHDDDQLCGTGLQDGLLAYYNAMAATADANVEKRIQKEPFFLMLKENGTAQHNVKDNQR